MRKHCLVFFLVFWFWFLGIGFLAFNAFAAEADFIAKQSEVSKPYTVKESTWIFGKSWQGRPLWAYSFGKGKNRTLYLGGVHAGVERGAVDIVNSWLSHLQKNKNIVPRRHKVIVIPLLNPDGYVSYSRVNAHGVDLNRNFSYNWQMWANLWSGQIYAGPKPFSEHESIALRDLMRKEKIKKLIDYHMGTYQVFAPYVDGKLDNQSLKFAKFYNHFARYPQNYSFDYYRLTGDITSFAAKELKANAVTVELGTREFEKNKKAMEKAIRY